MFNRLAMQANNVPEPPPTHARALSDSASAEQPSAPGTYKPYSEKPALPEPPYEPYGEKPAMDELPYEPYKGI